MKKFQWQVGCRWMQTLNFYSRCNYDRGEMSHNKIYKYSHRSHQCTWFKNLLSLEFLYTGCSLARNGNYSGNTVYPDDFMCMVYTNKTIQYMYVVPSHEQNLWSLQWLRSAHNVLIPWGTRQRVGELTFLSGFAVDQFCNILKWSHWVFYKWTS